MSNSNSQENKNLKNKVKIDKFPNTNPESTCSPEDKKENKC